MNVIPVSSVMPGFSDQPAQKPPSISPNGVPYVGSVWPAPDRRAIDTPLLMSYPLDVPDLERSASHRSGERDGGVHERALFALDSGAPPDLLANDKVSRLMLEGEF